MKDEDPQAAAELKPDPGAGSLGDITDLLNTPDEDPKAKAALQEAAQAEAEAGAAGEDPGTEQADAEQGAEIDYSMEVPIGAGLEAVPLSTLKDFYKENQDWQNERETWDETRTVQENEQMVVRQQLFDIASLMGDVKPEVIAKLQAINGRNRDQQKVLLAQVRPEWSDETVKKAASEAMLSTLKEYGFSDAEYYGIDNYKIIKLVDDFTKLRAKTAAGAKALEKAAEAVKLQKPAPRSKSKTQVERDTIARGKGGSQQEQTAAITALINKG